MIATYTDRPTTCPVDYCDGSGWIPTTDPFDGDGLMRCPCRYGLCIDAGLRLVALLEAEASYYPDHRVDVNTVAHRMRVALGMIPQ